MAHAVEQRGGAADQAHGAHRGLGVDVGGEVVGDRIGEVLMAVGGPNSVVPSVTITGMLDLSNRAEKSAGTDPERALLLVEETLHRINDANNLLGKEPYALAVNNVLAGFSDKHLEALYLLKQRAGR